MLWASLAFAGGIGAGVHLWRPPLWWLATGGLFAVFGAFFTRRRAWAAQALGLAALFAAGALTIQIRTPIDSGPLLAFASSREVLLTGHVARAEEPHQEGPTETRQVLDVETELASAESQNLAVRSVVQISVYSKESRDEPAASPPTFHYGERLRFPTKVYPPRNFRNPGAFDYRGYLADRGIVALASVKSADVERLPGFAGSRFELYRTRIRRSLLAKIAQLWPAADEAALMSALLVGEESFLERPVRAEFQRSGTYHVLVISGLKVAILALVAFWLLRRLRVGDAAASGITMFLTILYAWLTDVGAPVWRATLMLAVYLCARLLYRQRSTLNAIGAAALVLLVVDPQQLLEASFQLSFLCVLIIAGIALPVLEYTTRPFVSGLRHLEATSYDISLPPRIAQWRIDLRLIAGRIGRFLGSRFTLRALWITARASLMIAEFLLVSAVLQMGLVLPMAFYFHRATVVALPANILAVPLTELIMVAAIAALALGYVFVPAAKFPALLAHAALAAMSGSVHWLGKLRIADARVATPTAAVIFGAAAALALAMVLARRRPLLAGAGLAGLLVNAVWIAVVPPHPRIRRGALEITAIDVGQGDSILLVLPHGQTMLVDGGGIPYWMHSELDIGEDVVSPYLWSRGISRLDAVVVTHPHADHIRGMEAVMANFHPRQLWLGVDTPSAELEHFLREAKALGIPATWHLAGDQVEFGGTSFHILAPARDPVSHTWRRNEDSLVMKVEFGETSALLEGDAERPTERRMVEEEPQQDSLRADLLKVAHHGSATSTTAELLAAVHPKLAVISVGARNVYGHPRQEVLQRLQDAQVATYRTDQDGAVTFFLDGKTVSPQVAEPH